jgi:chromosome segregation ATPase
VATQLMAVLNKWTTVKNNLAGATGRVYRNKKNIRKLQEQLKTLKAQSSSLDASVQDAEATDAKVSSDCSHKVKSLLPELYARIDRIVDLHTTLSGK